MAIHEIESQWMGGMQFNTLIDDHVITLDAPVKSGGQDLGPVPKPLLLTAIAGCTGMDVVAILRKQQIAVENMNIRVRGTLSTSTPLVYTGAHIVFEIQGSKEDSDVIVQTVKDSQERFCGVGMMLRKAFPITWDVFLNGNLISTTLSETHAPAAS
jgi:putative redox protein